MQIYATTNAQLSILLLSQKMTHDYLQWFSFPSKTFGCENNNLCSLSGVDLAPAVLATKRRQSEGMTQAEHLGAGPKN